MSTQNNNRHLNKDSKNIGKKLKKAKVINLCINRCCTVSKQIQTYEPCSNCSPPLNNKNHMAISNAVGSKFKYTLIIDRTLLDWFKSLGDGNEYPDAIEAVSNTIEIKTIISKLLSTQKTSLCNLIVKNISIQDTSHIYLVAIIRSLYYSKTEIDDWFRFTKNCYQKTVRLLGSDDAKKVYIGLLDEVNFGSYTSRKLDPQGGHLAG